MAARPRKTRVWDAPLRVFHWGLAGSFALAWVSRGDQGLYTHLLAGYLFGALLLFRLAWGIVGGGPARFRSFLYGPRAAADYLKAVARGRPRRYLGHNPAGSWAVYAILSLGLLLGASGLVTLGAEEQAGPLAGLFGFELGTRFRALHEALAWTLLALVALHLAGVTVESLLHRENLPVAMITGFKTVRDGSPPTDTPPHRALALALSTVLLLFGAWWLRPALAPSGDAPFLPFSTAALPSDPVWQEECGACHLAYHPSLLPARSWKLILANQADHFGEDLALEAEVIRRLMDYALGNAAETTPTEASWKILRSIDPNTTPRRITQTGYWQAKHRDLGDALWRQPQINGRANCDACHLDAERGTFADAAMRIPGD